MRPWRLAGFLAFYLWELVVSSASVAWEVVTPVHRSRSGIIACPMEARTPFEVTWLANLISLTPGTLTIDVDLEAGLLFVHGLDVKDPESFRRSIGDLERRILEVLR